MSQPVYYRSDFEPTASPALLFFVGCVLICCAFSIGCVMGFEFRDAIQRELDKQPKPRPTVANPPQLIPCSPEGRIEHDRVCRARMRSGKVGL